MLPRLPTPSSKTSSISPRPLLAAPGSAPKSLLPPLPTSRCCSPFSPTVFSTKLTSAALVVSLTGNAMPLLLLLQAVVDQKQHTKAHPLARPPPAHLLVPVLANALLNSSLFQKPCHSLLPGSLLRLPPLQPPGMTLQQAL